MRKIRMLFLLLSGIQASALAQDSSAIFTIHPFGVDRFACCVLHGQTVKFKISNVNTIKLAGYSTMRTANVDFTVPAVFADTKIPELVSPSAVPLPDKEVSVDTMSSKYTALSMFTTYSIEKIIEDKKEKERLKNNMVKEIKKRPRADSLSRKVAILEKEIKALENQIALLRVQQENTVKQHFIINHRRLIGNAQQLTRFAAVENLLDSQLQEILISDPQALKNNTRLYMTALYGTQDSSRFMPMVLQLLDSIPFYYNQLKEDYETLNNLPQLDTPLVSGELKDKANTITLSITNAQVKVRKKKIFEEAYAQATQLVHQLTDSTNSLQLFRKAKAGIDLYSRIRQEDFAVYTDARQINDDTALLTPELKDKKTGKVLMSFNPITIQSKGKLKVNFTTGYLISFLGDDNYSYYSTSDTIRGISRQKSNKITQSIGALAHVYKTTCKGMNLAGSAGISITTEGDVGFYLGGSLLCLEKNRLAITAGVAAVKANRLNNSNLGPEQAGKYEFLSIADTKINYDRIYRLSAFLGITYNIFTK